MFIPHFVCSNERLWPELRSKRFEEVDAPTLQQRCVGGLDCWITRTYYELRRAGYPATIGPALNTGTVNVVAVRDFGKRSARPDAFVVIPRLDAHEPMLANYVIYQNNVLGDNVRASHVYHWPQPNIVPRDSSRGARLERLSYKGNIINLDESFRSEQFLSDLRKLEIVFDWEPVKPTNSNNDWGDYSSADAVFAVRNVTCHDARTKPASKLVNAWYGEVPAILGPEPAFQEVRQSELDFLEVRSGNDVISALSRLKESPKYFLAMTENGRVRRQEFTTESVCAMWISLLSGPIAEEYAKWKKASYARKLLGYSFGLVTEPMSKAIHRHRVSNGPRLLE